MNRTSLTVLYRNTTWHLKSVFLFILPSTVLSAWLHLKWIGALARMHKWEDSDTSWCVFVWLYTPPGLPWHPECVTTGTRNLWWSQLPSPPQGALWNKHFWTPGLCRKGRSSWHLYLHSYLFSSLWVRSFWPEFVSEFKGINAVKKRYRWEFKCWYYCVLCLGFEIKI